jgi:hypothetical protein
MLSSKILPQPLAGEHIVFMLRRHWLVFSRVVVVYLVLMLLPLGARYVVWNYYPVLLDTLFGGGLMEGLFRLGVCLYMLAVWMFFWSAWVDYYLDVWVVTNERVVKFQQNGLFNRTVSELRLLRVQDVSATTKGLLSTFVNFGEVRLETAGEQSETTFTFHQVPDPYHVSERILHLADECRHAHQGENEI